jgi:DNA-binding NtrC family response regulator
MAPRDGADDAPELARLRGERDLYLGLLELGAQNDVEPFVRAALRLVVELTGARQGYLELRDETGEAEPARWWQAHECSTAEVADIQAAVSRGIIAEALATGETVVTPAARMDPRFRDRGSVRASPIGAVLCTPVGRTPPVGVLYLECASADGSFREWDRRSAETFARHLAPLAERLLMQRRARDRGDPTRSFREQLRLDGVVGHTPAFAAVLRQVSLIAPLDVHVLLTGPSGSGKSQLARAIHENGPRASKPFVEVNCAALPETLIESELFGSLAGAHSTAHRALPGKVEAAAGGTLFLDEISEIPLSAQAKLLQLLQSKEYFPLGAARPVRADVRLIAASNADLEAAVAARLFREDLYYRLQVLPIRLPSLAERREDVPDLADHFLADARGRHGLPPLELSPAARRALAEADWPGNLRQLGHAVEAAAIRAAGEGMGRVELRHVFPEREGGDADGAGEATFQEATRRYQRELLLRTLRATSWNVAECARRLDLARSHVYNLINAFGLAREDPDA